MKLYTTRACPFTARIKIVVALKKLEVELVDPSEIGPEQFSQDVPEGRIPALVMEDGQILVESESICEYLEERYPERSVYPEDLIERAELRKWSRRADIDLGQCFVPFQMMQSMGKSQALVDDIEERFEKTLDMIERQLGEGPYIMGHRLTHVDGVWLTRLHVTEQMYKAYGMGDPFESLPKLQAYRRALSDDAIVKPIEDCYLAALLEGISKMQSP